MAELRRDWLEMRAGQCRELIWAAQGVALDPGEREVILSHPEDNGKVSGDIILGTLIIFLISVLSLVTISCICWYCVYGENENCDSSLASRSDILKHDRHRETLLQVRLIEFPDPPPGRVTCSSPTLGTSHIPLYHCTAPQIQEVVL